MSLVTIISDASVLADGRAGYAFFWKGNGGGPGNYGAGPLGFVGSSNIAELMAITRAVLRVSNIDQDRKWKVVLAQSDNLHALRVLTTLNVALAARNRLQDGTHVSPVTPFGSKWTATEEERTQAGVIRRSLGGRKLYVRHVKGHTRDEAPRSHVNRRCDELARQAAAGVQRRILEVVAQPS